MSIIIPNSFKISISIPYGELKDVVAWCQNNCNFDWRFQEDFDTTAESSCIRYYFYFENEKDYLAFILWKI